MIKCEVTERFTFGRFNELKNLQRKSIEEEGRLFLGDTFECTKEIAEYLMGKNDKGKTVIKIIEIIPEENKIIEKTKTVKKESKEITPDVKVVVKSKKKK